MLLSFRGSQACYPIGQDCSVRTRSSASSDMANYGSMNARSQRTGRGPARRPRRRARPPARRLSPTGLPTARRARRRSRADPDRQARSAVCRKATGCSRRPALDVGPAEQGIVGTIEPHRSGCQSWRRGRLAGAPASFARRPCRAGGRIRSVGDPEVREVLGRGGVPSPKPRDAIDRKNDT